MYLFVDPKQKTMLEPSRDLLLMLASFCQFFITSRRSSCPTESCWLKGRVVIFCVAKLTGSLSLTVLYYMDKTNIFLKITLINNVIINNDWSINHLKYTHICQNINSYLFKIFLFGLYVVMICAIARKVISRESISY